MINFSNGYVPIITIIRDGLHHLTSFMLDKEFPIAEKEKLIDLFQKCFECLKHFCEDNDKNQSILYPYIYLFLSHINFSLGQIPLICAIFKGNKALLEKIDEKLIQKFISAIENEGRQAQFLDFFKVTFLAAIFEFFTR